MNVQYHEVKVNIEFRDKTDCYYSSAAVTVPDFSECSLFVDYIYLDTDERRRFAQVSHEYLIEQLQFTGEETTSTALPKLKLNFNHPVKELIWVVQRDVVTSSDSDTYIGKQWFNYTDDWDKSYTNAFGFSNLGSLLLPGDSNAGSMPGVAAGGANGVFLPVSFEDGVNPVVSAKLQLNGHDRFSERDGRYFNLVQPYQHHENVPKAGINVYSFALKPEEHQPSGTCNMSRIDNATLQLTLTSKSVANTTARIRVYAVNYNVLRIMSKNSIARTEKCHAHPNVHKMRKINKWCNKNTPQTLVRGYNPPCDKTKLRETPKTWITSQQPRKHLVMVKNPKIDGQSAANWHISQQVQRLYGFGRSHNRLRYSPYPLKYVKRQGINRA